MISKQEINFQDFGEDEIESIVFDFGSDMIKAGFAGENSPRVILRTIVGRQKYIGIMTGGMGGKDTYIGEEAISKRGILNLKCPLEKGMIINWDDMEKVWHHTFYNELRIAPEEHPFLFSEFFLNPKKHQEKITEIMFEIFEVPAFYSEKSELFSLISSGKRTGLMIQSGHDLSYCVSIFEGEILNDSFTQLNLAGKSITEYLIKRDEQT
ncbi:actin-10-related [Anaeramoeba ignava]|uniref:Actin-10-related n=1 Tax=Anaeramoeba ignava TaxID=1746090 RepID=A0A9Q0LV74_ANAIG|nr:actin-10-related [Anaeramoeba ignava]